MTSSTSVLSADKRDSNQLANIFHECCDRNTDCRFQLMHCGYTSRASFAGHYNSRLDFRIWDRASQDLLLPQAICSVSFHHQSKFCVFLGNLIEVHRTPSGEIRVVVTSPESLTTTNLRQSFRVPVVSETGLEVMVHTDDGLSHAAIAHDIAVSGLEFEFKEIAATNLSVGDHVAVDLRFRDETLRCGGKVRRIGGSRCGIAFDQYSEADDPKLVAKMNSLILSLQQIWLKNRIS